MLINEIETINFSNSDTDIKNKDLTLVATAA
jgi:hypothetical protein